MVGGGVAGIQAALDLAEGGFRVYLVDEAFVLGGKVPLLSRTFPTNECSLCSFSPWLAACTGQANLTVLTNTRVEALEGTPGSFRAVLRRLPRGVDLERCKGCGACAAVCPVEVPDTFHLGFSTRKAIFQPYPHTYPRAFVIDREACIGCTLCAEACPAGAVLLDEDERLEEIRVGAVILCPGYEPFDPTSLKQFGYGRFPNVLTGLEFERLLSPGGPFGGRLACPSDGRTPRRIAWIQCVGSRNRMLGREYCSAVCCMAALKAAVTAREQATGPLETVIFYQDMRTYGKHFERYRQRAVRAGVDLWRAAVDSVRQIEGGGLELRYASREGAARQVFDLVILSTGMQPPRGAVELARRLGLPLDRHGFCAPVVPGSTAVRPGLFVAGAFAGPKDIAGAVIESAAAAAEAAALLAGARGLGDRGTPVVPERDVRQEAPRIGVVVCRCGTNIAGTVDVPEVVRRAGALNGVVAAVEMTHACSQDSLDRIRDLIRVRGLNRLVVAACSPRSHKPLFQQVLRDAGINAYLCEMANIRDHCAWVHTDAPAATAKACRLTSMAVAKARLLEPVTDVTVPVLPAALVVGAGPAGLAAALAIAEQGFEVQLVEKEAMAGGGYRPGVGDGLPGAEQVRTLAEQVVKHPLVRFFPDNEPVSVDGHIGQFCTRLRGGQLLRHGTVVLATGGREARPESYLYGEHRAVCTLSAAERQTQLQANSIVFIQCVGSRDDRRPYCSRSCCRRSLALALKMKAADPKCNIYVLYRDITVYGADEALYSRARASGVVFIRYRPGGEPALAPAGNRVSVAVTDPVLARPLRIEADLVILAVATEASAASQTLAHLFKVPTDRDGFFLEAHTTLRPLDFSAEGVFMCGDAAGPKTLEESLLEGRAVAARCAAILGKGLVRARGVYARVSPDKCAACLACTRVCPFNVPVIKGKVSQIEPVQCQGCGICVAECPNEAIHLIGYRQEQLLALLRAGLRGEVAR